ncbi:MAG: type IV pilus biogenesis/stability protein PilW [Shewanella sp.]|nr:type IV pilus biogenesis/stability protein PilW [Shewanella sp.]
MKQGLLQIGCVAAAILLSACVSERTYRGSGDPVSEHKFDPVSAARERMQLGLTYLSRGNSEQAKFNLDKAMEYAPDLEEVHTALAYYYQKVGDTRKAEISYKDAINSKNVTGDSYNNFGVFLCQQKKFSQSEKMFLTAIDMPKYTRSASSYENLGLCSQEAKMLEKARQYFELALKYDSRRATSLLELTRVYFQLKQLPQAKSELERYHNVAFQTPESLSLAIDIELGLNNKTAAKTLALVLQAKFPASPQAKTIRANMH